MSGLTLINGKNESFHSYKKIIGFVPKDDIVHGNLTVEENLWFRQSAGMPHSFLCRFHSNNKIFTCSYLYYVLFRIFGTEKFTRKGVMQNARTPSNQL